MHFLVHGLVCFLWVLGYFAASVVSIGVFTAASHAFGFRKGVQSGLALLKASDIFACAWWISVLYVVGLADRPTGREMISSYIGEAAFNGHRWAKIASSIIDYAAVKLGDKPNHCFRAFKHYQYLDD